MKNNTKSFIFIVMAAILCFTFASCKASPTDESEDTSSQVTGLESFDSEDTKEVSEEVEVEIYNPPFSLKDLDEMDSYPMSITKINEGLYRMECMTPQEDKLSLTFNEKSWGTYNIGSWSISGGGNTVTFAGGGTDWEYVYRSGKQNSGWVWSGGNHENEKLVSLDFYLSGDDSPATLDTLIPEDADSVRIVENTRLHWGNPEDYYCEVTRTYTIVGPKINLVVDYKYTQDCYHWLSYTCMFPVWKDYGRHCSFYDQDLRLLDTVTTQMSTTGEFFRGYEAPLCVINGDTVPEYKFLIKIDTITDSVDDFKNPDKTFYWDMNASQNKLYYSKFTMDSPTLVEKGTTYKTGSTWYFYKDSN